MEPFSLMFGFICLIGGGAAGWGLNNKLLNPSRQSSMIESVEESKRIDDLMQQNFSQINEKLTKLSINMEYIKKSDIKMEAVFMANEALQGNADLINALEKSGDRIFGVGVHGIIVYSDDEGETWTQSEKVPFKKTVGKITTKLITNPVS